MERGINPEGYKVCKYILKVCHFCVWSHTPFLIFFLKRGSPVNPLFLFNQKRNPTKNRRRRGEKCHLFWAAVVVPEHKGIPSLFTRLAFVFAFIFGYCVCATDVGAWRFVKEILGCRARIDCLPTSQRPHSQGVPLLLSLPPMAVCFGSRHIQTTHNESEALTDVPVMIIAICM